MKSTAPFHVFFAIFLSGIAMHIFGGGQFLEDGSLIYMAEAKTVQVIGLGTIAGYLGLVYVPGILRAIFRRKDAESPKG